MPVVGCKGGLRVPPITFGCSMNKVLYLYWGRRGLSQFVKQFAGVIAARPDRAFLSISRQNEDYDSFKEFEDRLITVETFCSNIGAVTQAGRILSIRRQLSNFIKNNQIAAVADLMPHVWSPFVISAIRAAGARYCVVVHDAKPHPGDYRTFSVSHFLEIAHARADLVFTLSRAVAGRLEQEGIDYQKIYPLFHPDLKFNSDTPARSPPMENEPYRLVFLGRIMPYKGLALFLDAVEILRRDSVLVDALILGDGSAGSLTSRIEQLGVRFINRWAAPNEIAEALAWCHTVVLSHIEASQSGIAAAALGAGVPVVCTPVGGLAEQIFHLQTGLVAAAVDGHAVAESVKTLLGDPTLYRAICYNISRTSGERSMERFFEDLQSQVLQIDAIGRFSPEDAETWPREREPEDKDLPRVISSRSN